MTNNEAQKLVKHTQVSGTLQEVDESVSSSKFIHQDNPFFTHSAIPDFSSIKPEHYLPAIDKKLETLRQNFEKIKNNQAPADFHNMVVALESLFAEINDVRRFLNSQVNNTYTKELGEIEEKAAIKISNMRKTVFQDPVLGARFQKVYQNKEALELGPDDQALLKSLYLTFESSGALLSPEGQKKIREIDEQLIRLTQKFNDNMQEAPKQQAVLITNPEELAGLSTEVIAGFAENARKNGNAQGWLITPERLMVDELLECAENTSFREKIFKALNRLGKEAPYDNRPVIAQILSLRDDFAKLLGYDHYAAYARSRAMTTDLAAVRAFLNDIANKALPKFEADMRSLEAFAASNGGPAKLEPWDVSYWATRQRDALYQFDANAFTQYLELENVLKGLFNEASHLFGIELHESQQYSTLHPDIRTFDVLDSKTNQIIGILHIDLYARPSTKKGGAWMSHLQTKSDIHTNIVILNMNISKPPEGAQALLGLSQYVTLYHEMGHSLQGLLGTNVKYLSQQGTAAPTDFVEFHSMVNERRAFLKQNLQTYALDVKNGQSAPDDLIDLLIRSKSHFAARNLLKLVQNSLRDLEFHSIDPSSYQGDEELENSVALNSPYANHIRPYPLARFTHMFSNAHSGYAAGYVNYLIAQVHAADGFEPFVKNPYNVELAKRLYDLYCRGGGGDPALLYRDYRGNDATPEAMLIEDGIIDSNTGE